MILLLYIQVKVFGIRQFFYQSVVNLQGFARHIFMAKCIICIIVTDSKVLTGIDNLVLTVNANRHFLVL